MTCHCPDPCDDCINEEMGRSHWECEICGQEVKWDVIHTIAQCWEEINTKYPEKFPTKEQFLESWTSLLHIQKIS
jgi:molybdopterin/thiamine biosynthesis adenylyltransferase